MRTDLGLDEDLRALSGEFRQVRRFLDRLVGEATVVASQGRETALQVGVLADQLSVLDRAVGVLTSVGEERQSQAQGQIESLVTRGLQVIFGPELSFHLVSSVRSNRPEVDFVVRSQVGSEVVETSVMDARGGGLAATVGFLLRLVVLLLSKKRGSILVLDETFAHLSREYLPAASEFLRELVDRTGVQIIMVTHQSEFAGAADVSYEFRLSQGLTQVARLA
jgi:predicted ATPase